jgi:hypothetical protein
MNNMLNHPFGSQVAAAVLCLALSGYSARADLLVSGDINDAETIANAYPTENAYGSAGPGYFSGAETFNSLGNVWNPLTITDASTPSFLNLDDSNGNETTIDFNFGTSVSVWRGNDPGAVDNRALVRDYITAGFTFTITGLDPTATVDFYAFGTSQFSGSYNLTIGGEQKAVSFITGTGGVPANAGGSQSWTGLTPDGSGTLSGTVSTSGFSGFHINQVSAIPEPGTVLLFGAGLLVLLARRKFHAC